ncbi:carboxypeptidase-like regulatory domain-containing protein [Emticicia sp. 21SJ11W-3]|uniref:carboxypeptidase-like regulatory domain-containing protein n=1 Tax=Emticicia sp. 21SJ11W-3 TaxID=2916755 RepID=UPI00209F9887|nr:carboxypeptidase-like regulatory domain-containing protein [Emticicia sp. 21SJ11W-3]UTA67371.1 carboxypeptidase-like regulatory domain-containing protein [Emticicia sp. 21SJ11W-3]
MKNRIAAFFFLIMSAPVLSLGQLNIEGRVIDASDKKPLPFANVFISNTTKGQQTDDKGRFKLYNVPGGTIDLVISFVGYRTFSLQIKADTLKRPLLLLLQPDAIELQGVTIKTVKDGYKKYIHLFQDGFMGKTLFSAACKLKNPKALSFRLSNDDSELIIKADEPLIIENKELGYVIKYQLEDFSYHLRQQYVSFYGYPFFEEMQTKSNKKKKEWIENRNRAYYGSTQHFFKALVDKRLVEEGYTMHKLIREQKKTFLVPMFPEKRDSLGNIVTEASKEKIIIDSADVKLRADHTLSKLPTSSFARHVQYLVRTPLKESEVISPSEDIYKIDFSNHIYVVYSKEYEEPQFLSAGQKNIPQVSILSMLEPPALVEKNGHLINPLSIIFEGRWGNEKIGELLPLDYVPELP